MLYKEASDNDVPDPTQRQQRQFQISSLQRNVLVTEGGNDYINKNRYYKWYEDNSLNRLPEFPDEFTVIRIY